VSVPVRWQRSVLAGVLWSAVGQPASFWLGALIGFAAVRPPPPSSSCRRDGSLGVAQRLDEPRQAGNVPKVVESSFHKNLTILNSHLVGL
jgi:hypothetical protein